MKTRKASRRRITATLSLLCLAAALTAAASSRRAGTAASASGLGDSPAHPARAAAARANGPDDSVGGRPASDVEKWVREELANCDKADPQSGALNNLLSPGAAPLFRPPLEHRNGWLYPAGSSSYQYIGWLGFNPAFNGYHLAQDMANPLGDPVYAVDTGDVIYSSTQVCGYGGPSGQLCENGNRLGGALVIQHRAKDGTWFTALYGHVNNPLPVGRHVYAGDTVGSSNDSNPPHVHFGIRPGFNPATDNPYRGYTSDKTAWHGFTDPLAFLEANSACKNGSSVDFRPNGGAPVHANGTLIRSVTDPTRTVYLIRNGQKQGIVSPEALRNLYPNGGLDFKDVVLVAQDEFDRYPTGPAISSQLPSNGRTHAEGRLIKRSTGGEVSIVSDGTKRPFVSAEVFLGLGYLFCNVVDATDVNYDSYPQGAPVTGATTTSCNYSISPASATVGSGGASGSLSVSAASGCAWSASSDAPWISITSGSSGSGNGVVDYSAAANPGQQRTGTITVSGGGQSFTHVVTQGAAAPVNQNPTAQAISDHADQLSSVYKVPSVVVKALLEQESGWRQFNSDGSTVTHTEPDGRIGIGLTQVTVQNTPTVQLSLGVIQEGVPEGSNPFTTTTQTVTVDVNRLKTDWQYNMEVGVRVLVAKKVISAGAGDDSGILENWYYPLAYYNGAVKGGANDPNNPAYTRTVSTGSDWKSISRFPYQECVFNIIAQLYPIPTSRVAYYGPAIKVTLPGPSAVDSGAGRYGFVESTFCFYDWAVYFSDGTVHVGNWGNQNNGCIPNAKTRTGIVAHKVQFGAPTSTPPSAPSALSPGTAAEPGAAISTTTPTFQWNASAGATRYSLFISKWPYGSANIVYSNTTLVGTSFPLPTGVLVNGEKYRWNMTASNSAGESGVSNTLYFTVSLPQPTRTLTVGSQNPGSGVNITASPNDNSGLGAGLTQFVRTYNENTVVSLTAPATAGGNDFQKWQRDGADFSTSQSVTVSMDDGHTMTAVYTTPSQTQLDSVSPLAGRASGGQQVRLVGSLAGVSGVRVGGNVAEWRYTNGTGEITLTTPPHAVGAVAIELTTPGGTVARSNAFAYLPTSFTDDPLVAGVTVAKGQHILELRQPVDALRKVAGLAQASWTDPSLTPFSSTVKVVHILELRTYLDEAARSLGYATSPYTDPSLAAGSFVKRIHIEELRQRIRAIAN